MPGFGRERRCTAERGISRKKLGEGSGGETVCGGGEPRRRDFLEAVGGEAEEEEGVDVGEGGGEEGEAFVGAEAEDGVEGGGVVGVEGGLEDADAPGDSVGVEAFGEGFAADFDDEII